MHLLTQIFYENLIMTRFAIHLCLADFKHKRRLCEFKLNLPQLPMVKCTILQFKQTFHARVELPHFNRSMYRV